MAGIEIPKIPSSAKQLEGYLAALFQASQHYVEKNVTEQDFTTVLELDVVATGYADGSPKTILAEAKSGKWGFADVFKLYGWMNYLGIRRGAFCAKEPVTEKPAAKVQAKLAPLGISFLEFPDKTTAIAAFNASGLGAVADEERLNLWIYANWIDRCLVHVVRQSSKSKTPAIASGEVQEYYDLINDGIFFERGMKNRLSALYDAFKKHPRLASTVAYEIHTGWHSDTPPPCQAFAQAMYEGRHDLVQAAFLLEHRAKLAIMKALSDHAAEVLAAGASIEESLAESSLPGSVIEGFLGIYDQPFFIRYPLFWQVFLWAFGGFILMDRQDEEFAALEAHTGVPPAEIPRALEALDALFPLAGSSWVTELPYTSMRIVKMVPAPFRGLGAFNRRVRYGVKTYDKLWYKDRTADRLSEWNDCAFNILKNLGDKVV